MRVGHIEPVRAVPPREFNVGKTGLSQAKSGALSAFDTKPAAPAALPAGLPSPSRALPMPSTPPQSALSSAASRAQSQPLYLSGLSKLADSVLLTEGGISRNALVDQAQAALRGVADSRNLSPARFAEQSEIADPEKLPSSNGAHAAPTIRTSILAHSPESEAMTLDLYVTRKGPSLWEAVAFNREDASRAGGFPNAASPVAADELRFDLARGQFASAALGQMLQVWHPPLGGARREIPIQIFVRVAISAAGLIASVAAWAADRPSAAAACIVASVAALVFTWTI